MPHPNLDELGRRPLRYWNADGLPELVMGLLWMVWGGAWLVGEALPRGWTWNAFWLFTPAFLAFSGVAAVWLTKWLKARLTFPRTGYVAWQEPRQRTRLMTAGLALIAALTLVLATRDADPGRNAAPIIGVILSLGFVVASHRQHAPHFLALAGVAVALAVALGRLQGGWTSVNWLFVGIGAGTALTGGLRLIRYLRRHPLPTTEEA
jgi:hypothetical protein